MEANLHDAIAGDIDELDVAAVHLHSRPNQFQNRLDSSAEVAIILKVCISEICSV